MSARSKQISQDSDFKVKPDLTGFVIETSIFKDGKKFDWYHNPITGEWKEIEA